MGIVNKKFLDEVAEIIETAQKRVKTAVNLSMVYAYYEIGKMRIKAKVPGTLN